MEAQPQTQAAKAWQVSEQSRTSDKDTSPAETVQVTSFSQSSGISDLYSGCSLAWLVRSCPSLKVPLEFS